MTNEEAIKILEVAQVECEWNAPLEYQEAFNMAIEALQSQDVPDTNVGDLISRQAAFDAKQEFRNPNVVRNTEARTAYDRTYANGWNDCNLAWINAIKALPSAQQEIIHCKDCIHWINKHLCEIWSRYGTIETKPYFYCGFGERINNE